MADSEVFRIEIPVEAVDKTEPALGQAQQKLSKFESMLKKTEQQIQKMNKNKLQLIMSAIDKASGTIAFIGSKAKALVAKPWNMTFKIIDMATKPIRAILNAATSAIGLMTAGAGMAGGIIVPMQIAGNYEQTQMAFETMLKSADKAKKFLEEASDFADKTPFEFPELVNSSKLMLAFGFQVEKILPMMKTVGDTSAGLGAGAEGIERITRAMGQMQAKGKVQAEEMLQLQELGVPAAEILREELGLTAEQVADIGKQGLASGKVIDALLRGMEKRFGGMMEKQAQTALGMLSTISDTIKNKMLKKWGEGLWAGVKPYLSNVVNWLDKNQDTVKAWGEEFKKAGENISKWVTGGLDEVKNKVISLTGSQAWKEASTLGKMKLAWDKIVSEPFEEWWNGPGQGKVTEIAQKLGTAMGGGIGGFLSAALGIAADADNAAQDSPFVKAGATAGKAFLDAFLKAFDGDKIAQKATEAFVNLEKEQGKFMPGGASPGIGSWAGLALNAFLVSKGLKWGKGLMGLFGKGGAGAVPAAAAAVPAAATVAPAATAGIPIFGPGGEILTTVTQNADDVAKVVSVAGGTGVLSKIAPALSKVAPVLEKAAWPLAIAGEVLNVAMAKDKTKAAAEGAAGLGGMWAGAKGGALIGTAIGGPIGTAVGGLIGGAIGYFGGKWLGGKAVDAARSGDKVVDTQEQMAQSGQVWLDSQGNVITSNGFVINSQNDLMASFQTLAQAVDYASAKLIAFSGIQLAPTGGGGSKRGFSPMSVNEVKNNGITLDNVPQGGIGYQKQANGSILTSPHFALMGEDGPEAIIPLGGGRRRRGIDLWLQAGRYLGVGAYAGGAIVGAPTAVRTGGKSVQIAVHSSPQIIVKAASSATEVLQAIKDSAGQIADELSDEIAEKLSEIFGNMPAVEE